ncbi:PDZ domain-containing protein [Lactobacillaceae bacterium Scapto_B20]
MKILVEFVIFILQPVFWLGLLRNYLTAKQRIKNTRQIFHTAIYPQHFETRQFWLNFFLLGVIGSIVTALIGPVMTISWLVIYQILLLINLLLIPKVIFSISIAVASSILSIWINLNNYAIQWGHLNVLSRYGLTMGGVNDFNYLLLVTAILFGLGWIITKDGGRYNVPIISRNERQTRIAGYPLKSVNVIPLLLFIPGDWIHATFQYWPIFMLNGHSFAFIVAPVLLGFRMTVFKRNPRSLFKKLGYRIMQLSGIGAVLTIASYWLPILVVPALCLLLIGFYWLFMHFRSTDRKNGDWYSEVLDGVRVLAIEPKTPAEKLKLSIGDIILTVNDQPVTNEDEFYRALLKQSTYCRLKVKNRDGRLIITETAIFNNAPHEIGVILFKSKS